MTTIFGIIPTCDDPMSIYTLISFMLYSVVLVGVARWHSQRIDKQCAHNAEITKSINQVRINVAVTQESMSNVEISMRETKTAVAEINKTLVDRRGTVI